MYGSGTCLKFTLTAPLSDNIIDPMDIFDPPDRETMRLQKFGKLLAGPNTDLGEPLVLVNTLPSPLTHAHTHTHTHSATVLAYMRYTVAAYTYAAYRHVHSMQTDIICIIATAGLADMSDHDQHL